MRVKYVVAESLLFALKIGVFVAFFPVVVVGVIAGRVQDARIRAQKNPGPSLDRGSASPPPTPPGTAASRANPHPAEAPGRLSASPHPPASGCG